MYSASAALASSAQRAQRACYSYSYSDKFYLKIKIPQFRGLRFARDICAYLLSAEFRLTAGIMAEMPKAISSYNL